MVVGDATRVQTRRDNALAVGTSAPPTVEDASENSRASPRSERALQQEPQAYVTVDALKGLMSTMVDTITQQVTEQVKRALDMTGADNPSNPPGHLTPRTGFSRQYPCAHMTTPVKACDRTRPTASKTNGRNTVPHLISLADSSVDAP